MLRIRFILMRHSDVISFNEQEMEGEKKQNKNQKITAKGS